MWPDRELNQQPLGTWDDAQPTEPHQPELLLLLIEVSFVLRDSDSAFSLCQDCGSSIGLAAGIPSLVATALLVALLFTLIHRRRSSSSESTEVISSVLGSEGVGRSQYWRELALGRVCLDFYLFSEDKTMGIPAPRFLRLMGWFVINLSSHEEIHGHKDGIWDGKK